MFFRVIVGFCALGGKPRSEVPFSSHQAQCVRRQWDVTVGVGAGQLVRLVPVSSHQRQVTLTAHTQECGGA